jgi:hypothetical protein
MFVQIEKAAFAFKLNGEPVSCENYGHGHINSTLKIDTDNGAEYILQRINKYVFKDPARLMGNIAAVTEYLRERVSDPRMALHFIRTHDGHYYHVDEHGEYWRMYDFVGGFCMDMPESGEDFFAEDVPSEDLLEKTLKIVIYRWNRHYPSDVRWEPDLADMGFTLTETAEFPGTSHEKITREVYAR